MAARFTVCGKFQSPEVKISGVALVALMSVSPLEQGHVRAHIRDRLAVELDSE